MPSTLEQFWNLGIKAKRPEIPASAALVADRLGLTLTLTSPLVPEQYSITKNGEPSGYIRVRWGGMSVDYPDAGDECLYEGATEGFGGFTDCERETQLLFALGLIAARMIAK